MLLAPIVCIVGGVLWFWQTRPAYRKDEMLVSAGKWSFIIGLGFSLWFYGAKY